jgi:hypothetical protein
MVPLAAILVLLVGVVAGQRLGSRPVPEGQDPTQVSLPRPEGQPLVDAPVKDGNLLLRPLSFECDLPAVFGTHAEGDATGTFCRVAVETANSGAEAHTYRLTAQRLLLADGRRLRPDPTAMAIRRQPDETQLGGRQLLWSELWFDVPDGAHPSAVLLSGDTDPPAYRSLTPARRTVGGVRFHLPSR